MGLLLAGYMFFDRAFAYLHVPGTVLFIGEIVLAAVGIYLFRTWPRLPSSLSGIVLTLFLIVSLARTIPLIPEYGADAIRDGALWYYGILAIAVQSLALRIGVARMAGWYERLLPALVLWAPVSLVLSNVLTGPAVPDSTVSVFSHRPANTSVLLAMAITYWWMVLPPDSAQTRRRRLGFTALAGMTIVLAGIQNRGALVASIAGLSIAALLARTPAKRGYTPVIVWTVTAAFALFWLLDVRISVYANNREISAEQLVSNLVSVVAPSSGSEPTDLEETSSWRLELWTAIFEDVTTREPALGLGYGVNVAKLYGFQGNEEENFRSAHNSHVSVFARSGWIGFGLWVLLWRTWFRELNRSRKRLLARGDYSLSDMCVVLIAGMTAQLTNAVFDPTIESPQVAAWVWSMFGFGLALIAMARSRRNVASADTGRPGALSYAKRTSPRM